MSDNFKVLTYLRKGAQGLVYRSNVVEPAEAVDYAEEWLSSYGTVNQSFCEIVFNGGNEVHARVFLMDDDSLGIWNMPEAKWPVFYPDATDGNIMLTGDPWPDQGDFRPGEGRHKKDDDAPKMKLDGEDDSEEDGFEEDDEAEDEAWEEDEDAENEIEDEEGDEDGDSENEEDEGDSADDDGHDESDDGETDESDDDEDGADDETDVEDENDGDDSEDEADDDSDENEDEGEDSEEGEEEGEDGEDENDEDEGDSDGEGSSEDGDEDEEDEEPEMPRLAIFAKMRGPLGWRKRAHAEELQERNTFAFKVGILNPDEELTAAKREAEIVVEAKFIESDEDRSGGVLTFKLPDGITPDDFTQTRSGWMTVRVPYRPED